MANNMDPKKGFLQTLIGLACYAQSLRDKGMNLIIDSFGVTSSIIFHIRQHGSFWAKVRKVIYELNLVVCRATFDNLDFRRSFLLEDI